VAPRKDLGRRPRLVATTRSTPRLFLRWPARAAIQAANRSRLLSRRGASALALGSGFAMFVIAHVGLAVAAASSLWIRDPAYADREAALSRVEGALSPGAPVVVMLGTSRTGNGFDAKRAGEHLAARLGRPADAFNFGLPAAGPILHRIYLARLLADGHRPALLLVEVLPPSVAHLKGGPLEQKFHDGTRFKPEEMRLLARYGFDAGKLAREQRETVVAPWYAFRFPLLGRVAPSALSVGRRHDESRTCDDHGWYRIWEEVLTPESIREARGRAVRDYAETLRELNPAGPAVLALRDALDLARASGIPTRLVLMPESSAFRGLYSAKSRARFDRWIRELSLDSGCPLIDARDWVPDGDFVDGHHLLPGGAALFTDRLVDEIAHAIAHTPGAAP
ncbi:MAG TPA: hypothetical protein VLM40_09270, partial [Gemmata sp.]|nr:hypothetical protein [Gemmata sp.]